MNTATLTNFGLAASAPCNKRYVDKVRVESHFAIETNRTPVIVTKATSGNRLTAAIEYPGFVVGSKCHIPVLSMRKKDHKRFYILVNILRDVLAKLIELANVCRVPAVPLLPATIAIPAPATIAQSQWCRTCKSFCAGYRVDDMWTCGVCGCKYDFGNAVFVAPFEVKRQPASAWAANNAQYLKESIYIISNTNKTVNSARGAI